MLEVEARPLEQAVVGSVGVPLAAIDSDKIDESIADQWLSTWIDDIGYSVSNPLRMPVANILRRSQSLIKWIIGCRESSDFGNTIELIVETVEPVSHSSDHQQFDSQERMKDHSVASRRPIVGA